MVQELNSKPDQESNPQVPENDLESKKPTKDYTFEPVVQRNGEEIPSHKKFERRDSRLNRHIFNPVIPDFDK